MMHKPSTFFMFFISPVLEAPCELTPCLMTTARSVIQLSTKMVFGTCNLVSCIVFLMVLRKASLAGQINTVINE
jgi:hypothetical protein